MRLRAASWQEMTVIGVTPRFQTFERLPKLTSKQPRLPRLPSDLHRVAVITLADEPCDPPAVSRTVGWRTPKSSLLRLRQGGKLTRGPNVPLPSYTDATESAFTPAFAEFRNFSRPELGGEPGTPTPEPYNTSTPTSTMDRSAPCDVSSRPPLVRCPQSGAAHAPR